jgi:NADPH2:quinone reductase
MKAVLSRKVGGPETLTFEEVPEPIPGKGQVLVAIAACGVNYPDGLVIEDRYQFKPPRPFSPGGEVSGTVIGLGEGVTGLGIGQRVLATLGSSGGMAEKAVADAHRVLPIPEAMPFDEAAGLIFTYGTSYYALKDRAHLKAGETLLVLGAAGGVGSAAVELGKAMGARVIAAVSSPDKAEAAKSFGADETVVYPSGPFDRDGQKKLADLFKAACGRNGADVIYDPVGGDYSEASLRAIAWEGRFLVVGFPAGIPKLPLNLTLLKSCQVVGVFWGAFVARDPEGDAANTRGLFDLYEKGLVKPRISKHFPLARGAEAIAWLSGRQALGKVVVTVP